MCRLPTRPEVVDLTSGLPPLPRLPLLAWRLIGGSTTSTSRTPPSPTSAADGEDRLLGDATLYGSVSPTFSSSLGERLGPSRFIALLSRRSYPRLKDSPWEITLFSPTLVVVSSTNALLLDASSHRGVWRQCSPSSTGCRGLWTFPPFSAAAPSFSPSRHLGARRKWRPFAVIRPS